MFLVTGSDSQGFAQRTVYFSIMVRKLSQNRASHKYGIGKTLPHGLLRMRTLWPELVACRGYETALSMARDQLWSPVHRWTILSSLVSALPACPSGIFQYHVVAVHLRPCTILLGDFQDKDGEESIAGSSSLLLSLILLLQ